MYILSICMWMCDFDGVAQSKTAARGDAADLVSVWFAGGPVHYSAAKGSDEYANRKYIGCISRESLQMDMFF